MRGMNEKFILRTNSVNLQRRLPKYKAGVFGKFVQNEKTVDASVTGRHAVDTLRESDVDLAYFSQVIGKFMLVDLKENELTSAIKVFFQAKNRGVTKGAFLRKGER